MNWTPDRPTKPGKYWLSLPKHLRAELDAMVGYETQPCFVATVFPQHIESLYINGALDSVRVQDWLAGAQWLPYVEPPDPFAEPVPSLRERVEALPTYGYHGGLDEIARRRGGDYLKRSEVLALFEVPQ
jgi:hypothetical protein